MIKVLHGDAIAEMAKLPADSVHAIVTDPPYHLAPQRGGKAGFMGRTWDGGDTAFRVKTWEAALRVLKPGGYLLAFGGTRTSHRMVCAIEDAGFEIRDSISYLHDGGLVGPLLWVTGQGFPKSRNQLKPAFEPIVLARKPLAARTVAANVLEHGTGALNIDACRIAVAEAGGRPAREIVAMREGVSYSGRSLSGRVDGTLQSSRAVGTTDNGRWPANVIHDGSDEVEAAFAAFGERKSSDVRRELGTRPGGFGNVGAAKGSSVPCASGFGDTGTAARFFYCAKATKADRAESKHPTVKPLALMRWLCQLVTPPGGTILDPFAGSGTTLQAAAELGFSAIGIELEAEHVADIHRRLERLTNNQEPQLSLLA